MILEKVVDLRVLDTDGKTKVLAQSPHICDRCKRKHAIIYTVIDDQGKTWNVGKTCCKRLFGWIPTQKDIDELPYRKAGRVVGQRLFEKCGSLTWTECQGHASKMLQHRGWATWHFSAVAQGIKEGNQGDTQEYEPKCVHCGSENVSELNTHTGYSEPFICHNCSEITQRHQAK